MNLNEILGNTKLNTFLTNCMNKTYYRYKLNYILEIEDFYQETYIFIMQRIKNFDKEKSSIKTYIPMLVMTSGKRVLEVAKGQGKIDKLSVKNSMISIDKPYSDSEDGTSFGEFIISDFNLSESVENEIAIGEIINLETLSEKQKVILILMLKGSNVTEIAATLNCSQSAISASFKRAKEKILNKFEM